MYIKKISLLFGLALTANSFAQRPDYSFPDNFSPIYYNYADIQPGVDCLSNQVIVKIKPAFASLCSDNGINVPEIVQAFNFIKTTEVKKLYPKHQTPSTTYDQLGRKLVDLSLVYNITYAGDLDIRKLITELNSIDAVEYAQPRMIVQPLLTPNDTDFVSQWYMATIRADLAWNLDTGSYSTTIGVIDGGTDFFHPDLMDNIYYDYTDSIGAGDEDNDGFVDNFRGWDVGDNDNYPQYIGFANSAHGTAMCGLAAGSTNNIAGIAGAGHHCSYMPVKMVHSTFGWIAGYEGLVYAADHGAKVLNASWGSQTPGPYEQDVVDYVTVNLGALLFAAAGNSNNTIPFYPAAYENCLAVGGTNISNTKSGNSSYYEQVDLVAPGQGLVEVYSPGTGGYGTGNGTSDACALTSGTAGLVQNYFSTLAPIQIGAIMRQSTYRIDTIAGNAPYLNRQGSGRIDMYAALTNPFKPYLYFNERTFTDNNDDVIMIGDTVELAGNMLNLLDTSTSAMVAIITDNSAYVQWLDSNVNVGVVNTMEYTNINAQPFKFVILPGCPQNQNVLMKVVYYDGTDTLNVQYLSFIVNRNYYHIDINQLHTSVTTTGRIGYADDRTLKGVGYRMKGKENNLFGVCWNPMGLFISKGSASVSDQTLGATVGGPCSTWISDADMVATQNIIVNQSSIVSDLEVTSGYNDSGAGINAVGVNVKQKVYAWADSINDQFLIVEYQFQNNTATPTSDWWVGLYGDFDMPDSLLWNLYNNVAFYDTVSQSAIMNNPADRYYVGFKVLSSGADVKYYANNSDGSNGHQNVYNGFSSAEKFNLMNPSVPSNISDVTDVAHYLGVHFDSLTSNGCAVLHMALLIGNSLTDIRNQATAAQAKFDGTFNVWTGNGGSSDWENGANWSQGTVPDFSDHVIVPDTHSGSGFSPLISTADGTVKNIEIRCGGQLDVNPPFKLRVGN